MSSVSVSVSVFVEFHAKFDRTAGVYLKAGDLARPIKILFASPASAITRVKRHPMCYKPLYGHGCGTQMSDLTDLLSLTFSFLTRNHLRLTFCLCSLPSPTNLTTVLGEEEEEGRTLSLVLTCPEAASTSTSSLDNLPMSSLDSLPRMPHLERLQVKERTLGQLQDYQKTFVSSFLKPT